jgi:hypothetical protein
MILRTRGKPAKVNKTLCKRALKWYAKNLLTDKTYDEIEIELNFNSSELASDDYGFTEWNDNNIRGRDFTIVVDPNLGIRSTLSTIAHEMVHVKQYATGELVDYVLPSKTNKCRWRGKVRKNYDNPIEYWSLPWEVEAHGLEKCLYYRFLGENSDIKDHFKRKKRKKR